MSARGRLLRAVGGNREAARLPGFSKGQGGTGAIAGGAVVAWLTTTVRARENQ